MNPKDMKMTQKEHMQHDFNMCFRAFVTYGIIVLAFYGYVPMWAIVVCNIVFYFSVYGSIHEVAHGINSHNFTLIDRMVPMPTPVWGGTRVFQETHQRHHVYFATEKDAWLDYYAGHPLKALFFCFIGPEHSLYNFIKERGIDREICLNCIFNLVLSCLGFVLFQKYYLVSLLSIRIVHGIGFFVFNFNLHRSHFSADADYATYDRLETVKPFVPLMTLIWGSTLVQSYLYHGRHHSVGNWYAPCQYLEVLENTGNYAPHTKEWPIKSIKVFEVSQS